MPRRSRRPRLRMFIAGRPDLANRLFNLLGAKWLNRMGRRAALRAARRAYQSVPFYREYYQRAGFDERRMRNLTWPDFTRLPTVGKSDVVGLPDRDLLDSTTSFPAADALIARSSGTTGKPTIIPTGWDEFYLGYAVLQQVIHSLGGDRGRCLVLLAFAVEGNHIGGGLALRALFAIKQDTHWPFEVCATGESPDEIISFLRYYADNAFESLYLLIFPGTMERMLDRLQDHRAKDATTSFDWRRFPRKHVQLSGQVVSRDLQDRIRRELAIADDDLDAIDIVLGSSDSGQVIARTSAFTVWLERYLEQHAEIAELLKIPPEHRTKTLMEFVPPIAMFVENDADAGLLLTAWKHRPLIRFRSNDLAWVQSTREVMKTLDRAAKGWRKNFASYGYKSQDIPRAATLGMILGRADDVCIVNGANVSPDVLRDALQTAGILPHIHHFKHGTGLSANEYDVYLELPDQRDAAARDLLARDWTPCLLQALVTHPAATDLQAANRGTPIDLQIFVRSRGEEEFADDDQRAKKRFSVGGAPVRQALERATAADLPG